MKTQSFVLVCSLAATAACSSSGDGIDSGVDSGSGSDAANTTDAAGTDSGASSEHLYVTDRKTPGGLLRVFDLPLAASSVPVASIPMQASTVVAVNTTTLTVGDEGSDIRVFTLPVSSSSTPFATFKVATGLDGLAFASTGTLYQTTPSVTVNMFAPPFSSSTTVSGTLTVPTLKSGTGIGFDTTGALYVCDIMQNIFVLNGSTVTTTAASPASSANRAVVASATQLFVANLYGGVYVFDLPLTASSAPVATITTGVSYPGAVAFDKAGNLYVAGISVPTITVYAPPFSDASAPVVTLDLPSTASLLGIAIGP